MFCLPAWDKSSGALNAVIETTKGSRTKLRYVPEEGLFELSKILPKGTVFPFDFGFIPSTLGQDGDPLDILVLLGGSVPAGCKVPCRLIGVVEAEQTEDGQTERNDRLIAVAEASIEHAHICSLRELEDYLIEEIEHFFFSYNELSNKHFKILGHRGPNRAKKLVQKGTERFAKQNESIATRAKANGKNKNALSPSTDSRANGRKTSRQRA